MCTCKLEGAEVSKQLIFMVHASVNVHSILDYDAGVSLTTCGQGTICWDCLPSLIRRIKAPNIVVVVLVVCSSETISAEQNREVVLKI